MPKIKRAKIHFGKQMEHLYTAGGNVKWYNALENSKLYTHHMTKTIILRYLHKRNENNIQTNTCIQMFISVLFVTAQN